jgi:hypothetical protein
MFVRPTDIQSYEHILRHLNAHAKQLWNKWLHLLVTMTMTSYEGI